MPQLSAYLHASLTAKTPIHGIVMTTIDRCAMLCDLLVSLARKRRPHLVKTFEVVSVQDFPAGPRDS